MAFTDRIVVNPQIRFGKPTVRGTRLTVGDVLAQLAVTSEEETLTCFPQLKTEDIRACLEYAAECERRSVELPA